MLGTKIGFYEIKKQLGQGGMGAVYLAEHARIGSRKVVKVLLPELSQNEQVVHRFENEARASAQLDHRNIIKIDDFGMLPSGQWYILMPFLEGGSLDAFLESHGKLPIHQALHILVQICAALHAAHSAGIIHRDLKPANIFLTRTEENPHHVTLLDFGIAKLNDQGCGMATQTGAAFGTPAYMAVEQFEDASRADARSDLYALGVIAYQMVTGNLPFGTAPGAILYNKQITTRPPRPAGVPFEWAAILMRALALRPVDRPRSAREFAVMLAAVTPGEPPFEPSGTTILTMMARELVTQAPSDAETVKHSKEREQDDFSLVAGVSPTSLPPPRIAALAAPSGTFPSSPLPATMSAPGRARRNAWIAGSLAGLAGMAVIGILATQHDGTERSMGPSPVIQDAGQAKPSKAEQRDVRPTEQAVPPAQEMSMVEIDSEPAGATLWVGGIRVGIAPQTIQAKLGSELNLRAELRGRIPAVQTMEVRNKRDKLLLRLEREAPKPSPVRKPAKTPPKLRPTQDTPFDPNAAGGDS